MRYPTQILLRAVLALAFFITPLHAEDQGPDLVELTDGKIIHGHVLFWSGTQLYFHTEEKGLMILSSSEIQRIRQVARMVVPKTAKTAG
ncbi:MAG TPA: hypothetical protein DIS66_05935 [Candidatus Omnitrophica bacterium]|nr:hypothetical protein [Candidatus Omnitrophota bacterium]